MKKFVTKVLDKIETHFMTSVIFLQVCMLFDIIKQYTANVPECYIPTNYGTTAWNQAMASHVGFVIIRFHDVGLLAAQSTPSKPAGPMGCFFIWLFPHQPVWQGMPYQEPATARIAGWIIEAHKPNHLAKFLQHLGGAECYVHFLICLMCFYAYHS